MIMIEIIQYNTVHDNLKEDTLYCIYCIGSLLYNIVNGLLEKVEFVVTSMGFFKNRDENEKKKKKRERKRDNGRSVRYR